MKRFNATHRKNGKHYILSFLDNGKIRAYDIEGQERTTISKPTVKRWYLIGDEIKPGKAARDTRKKLTIQQVEEVRKKHSDGQSIISLSKEYGMSYSGMYWICKGATWADMDKEREQQKKFEEIRKKQLHWYEYIRRGFSIGCQPRGFVDHNDDVGRWGIVAYDRPLTVKEMDKFELREYHEKKKREA